MKRFLLFVALSATTLLSAAQQMKELFIHLPDTLCPMLTQVNREDCIDFLACNMKAEVTNRLGGTSELKVITDDYLLFSLSEQVTWEMKLLPMGTQQLLCFVRTVAAPLHDSQVLFFTTDWQSLPASRFLALPKKEDFFLESSAASSSAPTDSLAIWKAEAFPTFVKVTLSPDDATLTIAYITPQYVRPETAAKLQPYLLPMPICYQWTGEKFEK